MRYLALACDYDGTLAHHGRVAPEVLAALQAFRESGRKLVLVTGRQLDDLRQVFPELDLFDRVVAENGALLFTPESKEERLLAAAPPHALLDRLQQLGVEPLAVGRVIVATWEPMEARVLEAIRELGLELHVIFNKGAVMVLPSGVNKATGLHAALADLHLSAHNTVGVGDAENDHALLEASEVGVAVQNAVPMLKEHADLITERPHGLGVIELIDRIVRDDLRTLPPKQGRRQIELGRDGDAVLVQTRGRRLLLCGASGSGKSTLATGFIEQLLAASYQLCLIDPEGDYDALDDMVVLGNEQHAPRGSELIEQLRTPKNHLAANLLAVALDRRPEWLSGFLTKLRGLRDEIGRPHFIVLDEAHHFLPADAMAAPRAPELLPSGLLMITVHPERVVRNVLLQVDGVLVVGRDGNAALQEFAKAIGRKAPGVVPELGPGEAAFWSIEPRAFWPRFSYHPPKAERRRHRRKYAAGALGQDKSFYFRGPSGALNLRAQNLAVFLQLAEGVDDATWLHHLAQHDYSRWVHEAIKNNELSAELRAIEDDSAPDPLATRQRVRAAIESVYTLPA